MTSTETIAAVLAAQRALVAYFDGGPDTPIRTTWPGGVECWELPAADLRPLLDAIEASAAIAEALGSSDDGLEAALIEHLPVALGWEWDDVPEEHIPSVHHVILGVVADLMPPLRTALNGATS